MVAPTPVMETRPAVGPQVGQKSGADDRDGGGFAAAVAVIMRLPLSDAEKAEVVQRLLQSEQRQNRHNRSN